MIVNPPGVLVGIGAPLETAETSASGGAGPDGVDMTTTSSISSDQQAEQPQAGEPADSGYMATQAQPASPQMWDPESVEHNMMRLGLDRAPR